MPKSDWGNAVKKSTLSQHATRLTLGLGLVLVPMMAQAQSVNIFMTASPVMPNPSATITAQRTQALHLFRALTGVSLPIDDARLVQMESYIQQNKMALAEEIATNDPLFYNYRVANLASKMTTRDESEAAPLSDFVATFVGVVRDSDTTPATQLLTGNFFYIGDNNVITANGGTALPVTPTDYLTMKAVNGNQYATQPHYAAITAANLSLKAVLTRVDSSHPLNGIGGQQLLNGTTAMANPDPAGLITSTAFLGAHALDGTNRRMVEYSYREFMCQPLSNWADGTAPDIRVGQDVDRAPGGSPNKYLTTCKTCHSVMDGQRGALAYWDWNDAGGNATYNTNGTVVPKMLRNNSVYPNGYRMMDNSFINFANMGNDADMFGWGSAKLQGNGLKDFAAMLAASEGFPRCMVRRVFTDVCKRAPAATEDAMVRSIADQFRADNYHLRRLFETIALRPECGVNQ